MKYLHIVAGFAVLLAASSTFAAARVPVSNSSAATLPPFSIKTSMTTSLANPPARITTLDIMGIGLSVEMFRQSQAWMQMQTHPKGSILPADLSKYQTSETFKELASEKRAADVLEYGASHFVEYWPIPSVSVWAYCHDPEVTDTSLGGKTNYDWFNDRVNGLTRPAGMHHHDIASLGAFFRNEPEEVMERAFQFFEQNPEVPALLLMMSDGDMTRAMTGDVSRKSYWEEGPRRFDSMTESFVVLVLARRERVDALRPFAWTSKAINGAEFEVERDRQLALTQAAAKSKNPNHPSFKPSQYLPVAWSSKQISQFDALPTIAVLHRPIRVSYRKDKDGKPTFDTKLKASLMHEQEQQAAFKTGFDAALQDIPGHKPARVFYDAGGPATGRQMVPLALAAHTSIPGFDLFKPDSGYDISARIGNTGAASPFVQWALAAMASYQKKNAGITVNLRQSEEATITVVTPSTDKRVHSSGEPFDFKLAPD